MTNGREWTQDDTLTVQLEAGRKSDAAIAAITGHSERTVRRHRTAMGLVAFAPRPAWTRRDWLLNSAAGLDFQSPSFPT